VTDVEKAATTLGDAYDEGRLLSPLTDEDPTLDEESAYAIAQCLHERRLARGDRPVGRKIGFTNRAIWEMFGVYAPVWGYLYDATTAVHPDGTATVSLDHLVQPMIEPEIQLHFAEAPPVTTDADAIFSCVDWIAHGFEIVQCPFPGWKFQRNDCIAAAGFHGALVMGPALSTSQMNEGVAALATFSIALSKNGALQDTGTGANVLDSPLCALAHLFDVLSAQSRAGAISAGEIVTTGTLTSPFPIQAGQTWSTQLEGIDLGGFSATFA
jgi:2-keto-4-pentenoate hydratase